MPGIIGVVGSEERGSFRDLSARMCQSIKHEDWYKTDVWLGEGVALGRVGLGTLNPEPQPVFSGDESLCIVFLYYVCPEQRAARGKSIVEIGERK